MLALLPKCHTCLAAYTAATGIGVSATTVAQLGLVLTSVCAAAFI